MRTVIVTNTDKRVLEGGRLYFSLSGWDPNINVWVEVVGGGGLNVTTNSSGSATGSFTLSESPGDYYLRAFDGYYYAYDTFTVYSAVAWYPCFISLVTSPTLTPNIAQVQGWHACFTSLVTSPTLMLSTSQVQGWHVCFTTLVTSGTLAPLQTSEGWFPCLTVLVTSGSLAPIPTSGDWFPCFTALVSSSTLKIPEENGNGEEETGLPGWVIPVAIIGGVGAIGAIVIAAMPKNKTKSEPKTKSS